MKQAGQVRRPFYAQAVTLILLCRILVVEFEQKHRRTAENALALEEYVGHRVAVAVQTRLLTDSSCFSLLLNSACDETFKALNNVIAAVTELKIFDTTDLEDHPAYQALVEAKDQIKACYTTFGVRPVFNHPMFKTSFF